MIARTHVLGPSSRWACPKGVLISSPNSFFRASRACCLASLEMWGLWMAALRPRSRFDRSSILRRLFIRCCLLVVGMVNFNLCLMAMRNACLYTWEFMYPSKHHLRPEDSVISLIWPNSQLIVRKKWHLLNEILSSWTFSPCVPNSGPLWRKLLLICDFDQNNGTLQLPQTLINS